jgi:hypothetical protein
MMPSHHTYTDTNGGHRDVRGGHQEAEAARTGFPRVLKRAAWRPSAPEDPLEPGRSNRDVPLLVSNTRLKEELAGQADGLYRPYSTQPVPVSYRGAGGDEWSSAAERPVYQSIQFRTHHRHTGAYSMAYGDARRRIGAEPAVKSSRSARREIATAAAITRPLRRGWGSARSTRVKMIWKVEDRRDGAAA